MYEISITSNPLTDAEKAVLHSHITQLGLDENIWDLYEKFLQTPSKHSIPKILRVSEKDTLLAAVYLIECHDHGITLSSSGLLQSLVRKSGVPVYVWMKSGIAAENFANPGFLNLSVPDFSIEKLIDLIRKEFLFLFILDSKEKGTLYPGAVKLKYPADGIIETKKYDRIEEYKSEHKNLKKKLRAYRKQDGRIDILKGRLEEDLQNNIHEAVQSTASKSLFKLPYQENYARMCVSSARIENDRIVHFICRNDEYFFGYHSFIEFGNQMRCMNGAFNRNLPSTFHAYENMIFRTVEYGIENGIGEIHYGPVLNETKKRMMARFVPTRLYVYSRIPGLTRMISPVIKASRMQNSKMMSFSDL